ncbi:transporter substrate-binding domain-containing protein [Methylobacterium aquaticum]|uniref:transporter substrate-binding domain-containing protein n=1 Tax=Methylobacterium aquaticum TaxID=270351 RepID=UPI0019312E6D|nr:transporter substrate-binding domain-containing protein [Methylobacterium aquaticum]
MSESGQDGAPALDPAASSPLRIAINLANAALVRIGADDGEPHGIAVDLGRALGAWLDRPVRLVTFPSAGAVMASVGTDAWDVAFLAIDPARADRVAYSRPYMRIEGVFAVHDASALRHGEDADRPQIRIASAAGAAYHGHLTHTLRHAELVTVPVPDDALRLLCEGGCEVAAGVRQSVEAFVAQRTDLRILPGRFMAIEQAIAVPRHGALGADELDDFLAHAAATGLIDPA